MVNYQNGKIYKITGTNNEGVKLIYIGSTTQKLCVRLAGHVRNFKNGENKSSSQVIMCNNYEITLIELCPCKSKEELLMRERYYYDMFDCVNQQKPIYLEGERREIENTYSKQYYIKNTDKVLEKMKQYYIENVDTICENNKQYRIKNADKMKQYRIDNAGKIKQYRIDNAEKAKQYRIDNADTIRENQKQYRLKKKENKPL
jgi:hypothetical protein